MHRVLLVAILVVGCSKDKPAPKADPPPAPATAPATANVDCAPLAEQAKTDWTAAAAAMAKLGAACSPHVESVVVAMVSAMDAKEYGPPQFAATHELLDKVPLSPEQNQRVLDATARLEKVATPEQVPVIQNQARRCIHNRDHGKLQPPPN